MGDSKKGDSKGLLTINREWTEEEKEFYSYSAVPRQKKKRVVKEAKRAPLLKKMHAPV